MIDKEVGELRRRFKRERCSINHIFGCYVNEQRQIIATFDQPMLELSEDEQEKYLSLLKKALSGSIGRQLSDITFSTKQVMDSPEHRLLSALREHAVQDEAERQQLYEAIIGSVTLETGFVILLAADCYDIPFRSKDGINQADAGEEQFRYIICSICPVKMTAPILHYDSQQQQFHNRGIDHVVGQPELGFVFPAFDDRHTNLYAALYYCRDAAADYSEFIDTVFHVTAPMPPKQQRQTFSQVLSDALEDDCSYEVVQSVNQQMNGLIAAHKESKEPQPLVINRSTVDQMLRESGVSDSHLESFHEKFDEAFGQDTVLPPKNLVDTKRVDLRAPDVVIQVAADRTDLVQTRTINGVNYIMIQADAGVELNGVPLHWQNTAPEE